MAKDILNNEVKVALEKYERLIRFKDTVIYIIDNNLDDDAEIGRLVKNVVIRELEVELEKDDG